MRFLVCSLLLLSSVQAGAQTYFQQKVDTHIEVRLDDESHFLHGFETIGYTNNSPDTLRHIYLHLWPNAYSSDETRFTAQQVANRNTDFYFSKEEDRGYIDSLDIRIAGVQATPESADGLPDIARIDLPQPLLPGSSIKIETPFRVKIPLVFSRMGHKGQAYYISQWFPKPAVYDSKGWHPMPYSDQGEFFSEIGSYDVEITLPKNYVVMATGNCENAEENAWLDSLSKVPYLAPERPARQIGKWRDSVNSFPPSSGEWKTLRFHEDNIHDFAWFADKRFIVRKDSVEVPAGPGSDAHSVAIYSAALPSEQSYWAKATEYMKQTITYLSEAVGPYPYKTVKAVEGDLKAGDGMEYPTVTVIDRLASFNAVMETLVHEVGHNWFYGLLASNERDYPWIDEGFNTFYERRITNSIKLPMETREAYTSRVEDVLYFNAAATRSDQSLNNTSAAYTKGAYGFDVYYKAANLLAWLEGYMGADSFRAAMKDYYAQWHYRHPYPENIGQIFQKHTNKPLDWLFEGAIRTDRGIDFAIKGARIEKDSTFIRIKNRSHFAAPVRVDAYKDSNIVDSAWSLPFATDTVIGLKSTSATFWRVGNGVPDYFGLNNKYRRQGLLHGRKLRVNGGVGFGMRDNPALFLLPAIGYNVYDGVLVGVIAHNLTLPQNRLRYVLAPMFSFRSDEFAGAGSVGYWIYPRGAIREIVPQLDVKTFHFDSSSVYQTSVLRARYTKVAPSLSFVFRNASPLTPVTRTLTLKAYAIWEESIQFSLDPSDSLSRPHIAGNNFSDYGLLRYTHVNDRTFNPFSYTLEAQLGSGFGKLTAEGRLRIDYNVRGKALHLRGFAGKYIDAGSGAADYSRYWLTTSYAAANDYLYDGMYFGRSEQNGVAARQLSIQEGGGKVSTPGYSLPIGRSDNWLAGINIKTDLPLTSIARLYFDVSSYADAGKVNPSGSRFLYSGGIELHALRDIFLLHVPLIMSGDYHDYLNHMHPGTEFINSISFAIQFQNVNWLRLVSSAMKYYLN